MRLNALVPAMKFLVPPMQVAETGAQVAANYFDNIADNQIIHATWSRNYLEKSHSAINSYSGGDIKAMIQMPNNPAMELGTLATISYSIHREKVPVRRLGQTIPYQYTRGTKTYAGSLIFLTLNKHVLLEVLNMPQIADGDIYEGFTITADQLPPFDVTLSFHNEGAAIGNMSILGIDIIDEGQTFSIDDLASENTFTYVARDVMPLKYDEAKRTEAMAVATFKVGLADAAVNLRNFATNLLTLGSLNKKN